MNTKSTKWSKWTRFAASTLLVIVMIITLASQASAAILFQDDDFHDIVSEGLLINSDDGGDEDVTLQLGNDGTDATMVFDDGTGDVTFATDGGDFSFSDDNLTTTGGILFSAASEFHIREAAGNPNTVAACTTIDEIVLDTVANRMYICTATGAAGVATWVAADSGSAQDFESVYSTDAGDDLRVTDNDANAFVIGEGANDYLTFDTTDSAEQVEFGVNVDVGGNALNNVGSVDATTEDTIEATIFDSDAQSVTGVWTWADNTAAEFGTDSDVLIQYDETTDDRLEITGTNADVYIEDSLTVNNGVTGSGTINFSGASAFRIREDSNPAANAACTTTGELIVDTTDNEVQICTATGGAGAATWVSVSDGGDADTLDGIDSASFLRSDTTDAYTSGTLTFNAGTTIDVNGEFDASGSTEFHVREVAGDPNTVAACTTVDEVVLDTTTNRMYVCTATGGAGAATWTPAAAANVNIDTMTWEVEWPDVVVYQDGTNNKGKLEALYDNTNSKQYYRWTTNKNAAHDIDLRFRYELPADFTDAGNITLDYRTATTSTGDNSVQVTVRNDTDNTTCHTDAAAAGSVANTWEATPLTITGAEIDTGCSGGSLLAAGDVVEIIVKLLADNTSSGAADVGTLEFAYTN